MDIQAILRATGVDLAVLNQWLARGLVPGVVSRGGGRPRRFDADTATFIGVMASLSRLNIGPKPAAAIAAQCEKEKERRYRLVIPEMPPLLDSEWGSIDREKEQELREWMRQVPASIPFDNLAQLDGADGYFARAFPRRPPSAFAVIDVGAIRLTMRAIEDELERDEPAGELAAKRDDAT